MFDSEETSFVGLKAAEPHVRREAAQFLARHPGPSATEALIEALGDSDSRVHEAIINAIVQQTEPNSTIAQLVNVLREDHLPRRNAALSTLIEIGAHSPESLAQALRHPSTEVRLHVAEVLGDLHQPTTAAALIERLADPEEFPSVRHTAAQALGKIGDYAATPALVAAAEQADFWVRFAAVEALGRLADPRALQPLLRLLKQDTWMRAATVEALGNLGRIEAVPDLAATLDDPNDAVRAASLEALLKIVVEPATGDSSPPQGLAELRRQIPAAPLRRELRTHTAPISVYAAHLLGWLTPIEALPDLIDTLGNKDELQRQAAVEAILRYGPAAVEPLMSALNSGTVLMRENAAELLGITSSSADSQVVTELLSHLTDRNHGVRQAVVRALGTLGGERAYEGLLRALADTETRDTGLAVIGQLRDPELIGYLQRYLYQDPAGTRQAAAQALSLLGDETAVSILLNAMRLPDDDVRQVAAEALGRVRNPRAVAILIEALGDRNWLMRQKAVEALGSIPDGRAVSALLAMIVEPDWRVRRSLALSLVRIGDGRIYEALRGLAQDSNRWIRRQVMEQAAGLDDSRAVEMLMAGLEDSEPTVRQAALMTLGRRREAQAAGAVAACLADADPLVRQAAARALGLVDPGLAAERLPLLIHDPEETVRQEVAEALGEAADDSALETLTDLLEDDTPGVRARAAEALAMIGTQRAIEALVRGLTRPLARPAAQAELSKLGAAALRVLLASARGAEPELRAAAAETIGAMRLAQALPTLRLLTRDTDARVRQAAEAAVATIGPIQAE